MISTAIQGVIAGLTIEMMGVAATRQQIVAVTAP